MSKKEKREKDQEKNIPQQETACEEETEKQPEAETKAGDIRLIDNIKLR